MINEDDGDEWGYPCISSGELRAALDMVSGSINIFINSPGGDVFEGARMVTAIEDKIAKGANITLIVDGVCASAATYMLVADGVADRKITKFSQIMIHNCWVGVIGNAQELRDMADVLERTDAEYARELAKIMPDTSEEQVRELMDKETWLTADASIEAGIVSGYYTNDGQEPNDMGEQDAPDNGDEGEDMNEGLMSNRLHLLNIEAQRTLLGF